MNTIQITDWHIFQRDGEQFLQTAQAAFMKKSKGFSPEVIYNLTCMGIEKLIMAFLMQRGDLADNHTMADLVEAMDETFPGAIDDIREGLIKLDTYQDICDPYDFTIASPAREEIPEMLGLAKKLQQLVDNELTVDV